MNNRKCFSRVSIIIIKPDNWHCGVVYGKSTGNLSIYAGKAMHKYTGILDNIANV